MKARADFWLICMDTSEISKANVKGLERIEERGH